MKVLGCFRAVYLFQFLEVNFSQKYSQYCYSSKMIMYTLAVFYSYFRTIIVAKVTKKNQSFYVSSNLLVSFYLLNFHHHIMINLVSMCSLKIRFKTLIISIFINQLPNSIFLLGSYLVSTFFTLFHQSNPSYDLNNS